jgi:hypothetical protein
MTATHSYFCLQMCICLFMGFFFFLFPMQALDGLGLVPIKSPEIQIKHSYPYFTLKVRLA